MAAELETDVNKILAEFSKLGGDQQARLRSALEGAGDAAEALEAAGLPLTEAERNHLRNLPAALWLATRAAMSDALGGPSPSRITIDWAAGRLPELWITHADDAEAVGIRLRCPVPASAGTPATTKTVATTG